MSILGSLLDRFFWWRKPSPDGSESLLEFLCCWETVLIRFQKICVWDNPWISFVSLVSCNVIFWFFVYFEWTFYGMFFFCLFIAAAVDWAKHQGLWEPSRGSQTAFDGDHMRVFTVEELNDCIRVVQSKTRRFYQRMRLLRENQPGSFCAVTCVCCLGLSFIGRALSGIALLYSSLTAVLTLPALFVRFPQFLQYVLSFTGIDEEVDEYLPSGEGVIRILNLEEPLSIPPVSSRAAGNRKIIIGEDSLYPDLNSMPSHCEPSLDYLDPNTDIPSPRLVDADSENSDLSEVQELSFQPRHFNGESSSGDELSKGLRLRAMVERESSSDSSDSFEFVSKDEIE